MSPSSLLRSGRYSTEWVRGFYAAAAEWWGPAPHDEQEDLERAAMVRRTLGEPPKRVLELGAGSGLAAAATADLGYDVMGVDLVDWGEHWTALCQAPRTGSLELTAADFYEVRLDGRFDLVCYWDGFGIGCDDDQRRLLRRVARHWLAPAGRMLVDVANPAWAARNAGKEEHLAPLKGVPGSVEMVRRWYYDALHSQWIDEWMPTAQPEQALQQTIRCYSPQDLQLLLEGTGLRLCGAEVDGQRLDVSDAAITTGGPLLDAYSYLAELVPVHAE